MALEHFPCRFGFECLAWEKHAEVSEKIWLGFREIESVGEKGLRVWEELARFLGKFVTDFEKCDTDLGQNCHRLWENLPPTLRTSATDFEKIHHRLWKKIATDFGKICHRLWENLPPTLRKSVTDFGKNLPPTLEKCATGFVKLRFCEKNPSVQSFHPSFHQGHKLPSSIALPTTKRATCLFYCCDHSFCFFLSFSSFPTVPLPHFPQPLLDRDIPYSFSFPQPHLTQARVHISHIVDVKQRVHHAKAIRLPSPTHTKEGSVSQVSSLLRDQHAHMYAILVS